MRIRNAAIVLTALSVSACADPPAEFILAIDTDMGLPQLDVEKIYIRPVVNGVSLQPLEPYDSALGLPATLAILAPDDPDADVIFYVTGIRDGIRRTRKIVPVFSTEPVMTDTAWLSYLCAGSGNAIADDPATPEDETKLNPESGSCVQSNPPRECIDGWCAFPPDIGQQRSAPGFGCFDTVGCFEGEPQVILMRDTEDEGACAFKAQGVNLADIPDLNVALVTADPSIGTCGADGCYIPLNDTAWVIEGDRIRLPCEVCARLDSMPSKCNYAADVEGRTSFKPSALAPSKSLLDVKAARCTPQKTAARPLCNLSTRVGPGPVAPFSITLASKQAHPASIAVSKGDVYWVNSGTGDPATATDSTLMWDETPSQPLKLADTGHSFRDIAIVGDTVVWTDADNTTSDGAGTVWCHRFAGDSSADGSIETTTQPGAVAAMGSTVFWAEKNGVQQATVSPTCEITKIGGLIPLVDASAPPFDIAITGNGACWTSPSVVQCTKVTSPSGLKNPKGIATYFEGGKAVYGAIADADSKTIAGFMIVAPSSVSPAFKPVETKRQPSGVAVDASYVYWTEPNENEPTKGEVYRVLAHPKSLTESPTPELLAQGQNNPSAIVVDENAIYWVNEGSPIEPTGSIAARSK